METQDQVVKEDVIVAESHFSKDHNHECKCGCSKPKEEGPPVLSEEQPLNPITEKQLSQMMHQMRDMMGIMEAQWESSKKEFQITDTHMKTLYAFNEKYRTPPPEGMTEDEMDEGKYDRFNGLDKLTEDDIHHIFGESHPILVYDLPKEDVSSVDVDSTDLEEFQKKVISFHPATIDRIKSVVLDFFSWMGAIKNYRQVHDAYMELMEFQEDKELESLKIAADNEEDPEKKKKILETLEVYYSRKYLDFLAEELDKKNLDRLVSAFSDQQKIDYWIGKARSKLKQLGISEKFILEISQFEKRFLEEKYHHQSNILLLYFLSLIAYSDIYDKTGMDRAKIICFVFGLDRFVRNVWKSEIRERILNNIISFQDQFMNKLPKGE